MSEQMSKTEFRTVVLSSIGSALEYYDFTVFVFLTVVLSGVFFPPQSPEWVRLLQTYSIFALGYFIRPVAGVVIAHFGDKIGRKKMFLLSLLLMAVPTLCIGLLPTYQQVGWVAPALLLIMRLLQGCALAGELPGAVIFVAEHSARRRLGYNCAVLQGIVFLGLAVGSSTSGLLSSFLTRDELYGYGWRLPFLLGGAFGLVSVYLRRYLHETPLFTKLRETRKIARKLPLLIVIKDHLPSCLFVFGLGFFTNQITTVMFQYMPTLLITQFNMLPINVYWTNTTAIVVYATTCLLWGWIADRIGRGRSMAIGAVLTCVAAIWMFYNLADVNTGGVNLYVLWCFVGIGAGFIGLYTSMTASVFPTSVRLTGLSFPYNMSVAFGGGLTPVVLTWLVRVYGRDAPLCLAVLACVGFFAMGLVYQHMRHYLGAQGDQDVVPLGAEIDQARG